MAPSRREACLMIPSMMMAVSDFAAERQGRSGDGLPSRCTSEKCASHKRKLSKSIPTVFRSVFGPEMPALLLGRFPVA